MYVSLFCEVEMKCNFDYLFLNLYIIARLYIHVHVHVHCRLIKKLPQDLILASSLNYCIDVINRDTMKDRLKCISRVLQYFNNLKAYFKGKKSLFVINCQNH